MMGFEFFNKKGQLSPRKILFTNETCPNKTQRVLSNLFGTIMKWNARRWAENLLENTQINQNTAKENVKNKIDSLMQDIRKDGFVRMSELFNVVALANTKAEPPHEDDDQNSIVQTGNKFRPTSAPFLINHDEVARKFKAQSSSSNQEEIGSTKVAAKDTKPDESELFGACQIIEDYWILFSKTNGGEGAPDQYKLPVKSGFLDYCRGSSTRKTDEQAVEQLTSNTLFIEMTEKQWSLYGRVMPAPQYAAWTKKRDEWIALSRKSIQARAEDQTPKRDPRLELKTEKPTAPTDTARTIVQEFLAIRAELMETSHGNPYLPPPVQAIFDSGFIDYCDRGISAFPNIDLAKLEEFINQDESKFKVFSKILSPENFSKLKEKRDEIAQKIAQLCATPPAPSGAPEDNSEKKILFPALVSVTFIQAQTM